MLAKNERDLPSEKVLVRLVDHFLSSPLYEFDLPLSDELVGVAEKFVF